MRAVDLSDQGSVRDFAAAGKRKRRGTVAITDDRQRRSAPIHWPADAGPDRADLFAHNDIVINAPAEVIWDRLIRATAWPEWYSNATSVTVSDPGGVLGPGVTFDWATFGAAIHNTVHEFEPASRIGWYATTDQWFAYHLAARVPPGRQHLRRPRRD